MRCSSEQSPEGVCEAIADSLAGSGFPADYVVETYLLCLQLRNEEETHRRATSSLRRAVRLSEDRALALRHDVLGPEHILLGLSEEGEGVAAQALRSLGVAPKEIARSLGENAAAKPPRRTRGVGLTAPVKQALALSLREGDQLGHDYIGTGHVLLGLLTQGDDGAVRLVATPAAGVGRLREMLLDLLGNVSDRGPDARVPPVASHPVSNLEANLERLKDRLEDFERLVRERYRGTGEGEPEQP